MTLENDKSSSLNEDFHYYKENSNDDVTTAYTAYNMPPNGKSIAHNHFSEGGSVFLSLDIETGGDLCGIGQLFCQIFCII